MRQAECRRRSLLQLVWRSASGSRAGRPRGQEDRHDPLLRRRRVDDPRGSDRSRDDTSRHDPVRRSDGGGRASTRRNGRAVPRRRGDGRLRSPDGARGRRAASSARRDGDATSPRPPERGAARGLGCRADLSDRHQHGGGRGRRSRNTRDLRHRRRGEPRKAARAGRRARDDPDRHGHVPAREGRGEGRPA